MDKRIAYTRPDGGVSVVIPAAADQREGESEVEFLARVQAKSVPADATNVSVCLASDLPDRRFRNAWTAGEISSVAVDMSKARIIKTDRVRLERDRRLVILDAEYFKAAEKNDADALNSVAAKKQALRDLPVTIQPDIEAIADPVLLDDFTPVWPPD